MKWNQIDFYRTKIAKLISIAFLSTLVVVSGSWFASVQGQTEQIAASCQPLVAGKIYRHIEGIDNCVIPMSDTEIQELTDPFALALLRKNIFPDNPQEISEAIANSDLGFVRNSYVGAVMGQVPTTAFSKEDYRGVSFIVTWGQDENNALIMMTVIPPSDEAEASEIMSFDLRTQKYNYYELVRSQKGSDEKSPHVWAWAGNSTFARKPETAGKGCFTCHHNGIPIFKELEFPWNNWHSQRAFLSSASVQTKVATESFFQLRRGAEIFENVIRASFQQYYQNLFAERTRKAGMTTYVSEVDEMLRHLTSTTTVNLKSTDVQGDPKSTGPADGDIYGVPPSDTFLSDTLFNDVLRMDYSPLSVTLDRDDYEAYLKKYNFTLLGTSGIGREEPVTNRYEGTSYFAYFVPQVPPEDVYVTQLLLRSGIITEKFAGSLLMVDFKNPLFSEKRGSLQKYAEEVKSGTVVNGVSSVPTDFVNKIKATGAKACQLDNIDNCTAEEQFLYTWELPDRQWKQLSAQRLQAHVNSVINMSPNKQLDTLMGWSIKQRDRFASAPELCHLYEIRALLPKTDLSEFPPCPNVVDRVELE